VGESENVAAVRRVADAFKRRDFDAVLAGVRMQLFTERESALEAFGLTDEQRRQEIRQEAV
jgi:hypothetical protein